MKSLRAEDPEHIGGYRLLGRLGEGGMGRVYLAQSDRGRTVAVKLVRPELAEDGEFRARFEHEVAAARRVGGEWTAPVLDADTGAERPWVATGYIPGIPLHEAVAGRRTPLPVRTLRILANRLARALEAVHSAGLVHRDVKPSNILVTIDGPRLIDFGIARALETVAEARLTRTGAVLGSPGFMSPEQVRGERLTGAGDVFSLGAVLAFAATGRSPFGAHGAGHVLMYRIANDEPDLDGVPGELRGLIADCLAKDAGARPTVARLRDRTADPADEPGPTATGTGTDGADGADAAEPWLPAGLVAHLARHAANLLHAEVPGARAAAARAAAAPSVPLPPSVPPRSGLPPAPGAPPLPTGPPVREVPPAPDIPAPGPITPPAPPGTSGAVGGGVGPRRRALVLTASAVALALVAGLGTYTALQVFDGREDSGEHGGEHGGKSPAGSGGSEQGTGDKTGPGAGSDGSAPASGGSVPKGYIGAWQTKLRQSGTDPIHRFDISAGKEGDIVGTSLSVREKALCEGELRLVAVGTTMVLKYRLKDSYPTGACEGEDEEVVLSLADHGNLTWTRENGGTSKVRPIRDRETELPGGMAGTWRLTEGAKVRTIVLEDGALGEATATDVFEDGSRRCEFTMVAAAMDGSVRYGPGKLTSAEPRKSSCSGIEVSSSHIIPSGDDGLLVRPLANMAEPDVLKRVD